MSSLLFNLYIMNLDKYLGKRDIGEIGGEKTKQKEIRSFSVQ